MTTAHNPNDKNLLLPRRRRRHLAVVAGLGLMAVMTWLTGRNGGGACLGGACMISEVAHAGTVAPDAKAEGLGKNREAASKPDGDK